FLDLMAVVETLVRAGRDLQLVILGDGPQRGELERTIVERQLDRHVRLLGHRNDVSQWLEAMDLFVLSSLREGLPNVLLEAMALETPVVATEVGGVARLVRHNTNGLLVPPASPAALATAIANMLDDEPLSRRLTAAARATIAERFDFSQRMRAMRDIYDELLRDTCHD
ncbi:MAG TPA: glycosyltransferase, partial [Pirellulaceae bacterium]|nr:glycosyltransferase [Pirellulaceae bacterium]